MDSGMRASRAVAPARAPRRRTGPCRRRRSAARAAQVNHVVHITTRTTLSRRGPQPRGRRGSRHASPSVARASRRSPRLNVSAPRIAGCARRGLGTAAAVPVMSEHHSPAGGFGPRREQVSARQPRGQSGSRTHRISRHDLALHPVARPEDGRGPARLTACDRSDPAGSVHLPTRRVLTACTRAWSLRSSAAAAARPRTSPTARGSCSSLKPRRARRARGRGRRARYPASATSSGSTGSPLPSRAQRRDPRAFGSCARRSTAARPPRRASRSTPRDRTHAPRLPARFRVLRGRDRACPDCRASSDEAARLRTARERESGGVRGRSSCSRACPAGDAPMPPLIPSVPAGPLTTRIVPTGVAAMPWALKPGSSAASAAARTTGK